MPALSANPISDVPDVFNIASNGAIVLRNEILEGDLTKEAIYKIGGSAAHRDVNSTSTVSGSKIDSDERVGVKMPWKYGPYETTEEAFKRRARSPEEFSQLVGEDAADAAVDYMVQAAFGALEGAIGANSSMTVTSDFATNGRKVLTAGMRLFGDRRGRIALFAMDSTNYFDLVDDAITEKIYEEAGFVIYGGLPGTLGKPVLVSDKVPDNSIFGLVAGAIQIVESQPPGVRSYPIDNQENLAVG